MTIKEAIELLAKQRANRFATTLNQPPKGAHLGKHRRTSPTTHRDPADRTDPGAGAYGTSPAIPFSVIYTILPNPSPPTTPYAGIRSGEIIGHRLWWVTDRGLSSLAHNFIWQPGATIEGDINKIVYRNVYSGLDICGGVYCFSDYGGRLRTEIHELIPGVPYRLDTLGLARGTVKLWGEVVEHEHGYRAQFAKLHSLDHVWCDWNAADQTSRMLAPYFISLNATPLAPDPI